MKSSGQTIPPKNVEDADAHEELAGQILSYLAQDTKRLERFFALTGIDPSQVRRAATQPGFAVSVILYLGSDERLLTAFASESGFDPAAIGTIAKRLEAKDIEDGA